MVNEYPQVMTIAGSDSDGSAGMQADMNTFLARKVYGTSILTAAVAGNSYGIMLVMLYQLILSKQSLRQLQMILKFWRLKPAC